jgi:hypothetical protein
MTADSRPSERTWPRASITGTLRPGGPVRRESLRLGQPTRLFALAFMANALDLVLSWVAVLQYGVRAEANPLPLMSWGWSHGFLGAMAVKAALLAIVVAAAALKPRHANPLLYLVGFAGAMGAISAVVVLRLPTL